MNDYFKNSQTIMANFDADNLDFVKTEKKPHAMFTEPMSKKTWWIRVEKTPEQIQEEIHQECLGLIDRFRGKTQKANLVNCAMVLAKEIRNRDVPGDRHDTIRYREYWDAVIQELQHY